MIERSIDAPADLVHEARFRTQISHQTGLSCF